MFDMSCVTLKFYVVHALHSAIVYLCTLHTTAYLVDDVYFDAHYAL